MLIILIQHSIAILLNRGYASSCRINRDNEQNELEQKIDQTTAELLHKKVQLEQEKLQLDANIARYREAFREVSTLYKNRSGNTEYDYNIDDDFDEDLFDTDEDDDDDDEDGNIDV